MWPPEAASPPGENRLAAGAAKPAPRQGSLNRRFEWFSLVTFFLQKKKVTRAGARNTPSRARRRNTCSPLSVFPHVTGVFLIVVVPPTVPAQLSAAAACYYGKNYSFCCVAGYYILCPTDTPTFAALRRQRRDLIIAKNDQRTRSYPHCCQRQRRKRYKQSPEPTMLPTALHARVHTAKSA